MKWLMHVAQKWRRFRENDRHQDKTQSSTKKLPGICQSAKFPGALRWNVVRCYFFLAAGFLAGAAFFTAAVDLAAAAFIGALAAGFAAALAAGFLAAAFAAGFAAALAAGFLAAGFAAALAAGFAAALAAGFAAALAAGFAAAFGAAFFTAAGFAAAFGVAFFAGAFAAGAFVVVFAMRCPLSLCRWPLVTRQVNSYLTRVCLASEALHRISQIKFRLLREHVSDGRHRNRQRIFALHSELL